MHSFNLVEKPWIPTILLDGRYQDMSLKEVLLSPDQIKELYDSSPLVTAALHRLLLAILYRNFPCKSLQDWKPIWKAWDYEKLASYLEKWKDRFDLFHKEHPFYQLANFSTKKPTPIKRLGWEFAAGNNATLFDHSWDEDRPKVSPSTAARWIIATHLFAASAGKSETLHTKDSPWTRGAVILMQGNNLFETLNLNLLSFIRDEYIEESEGDLPTWEQSPNWKPEHDLYPSKLLEYLTWQSRAICLIPEDDGSVKECYFAQGRAIREDWRREPMFAYNKSDKEGYFPWQFREDKAIWRDSHTLFDLSGEVSKVPYSLCRISELIEDGVLPIECVYQLQILGQCLESGKPTINFLRQESLPLRVEYLQKEELLEKLKAAIELSEEVAEKLRKGLWQLSKLLLATNSNNSEARQPDKKDIQNLVNSFSSLPHYWSQMEIAFKDFLTKLPDDESEEGLQKEIKRWAENLRNNALEAFKVATRSLDGSARKLKAAAIAENSFRVSLFEALGRYLQQPTAIGATNE
ncbi:MAG: type I-E CRISPR-associated protein Cse1/CasA [Blastocatellia bacterium]|nr:type I-E CRISPR-associated protein Cse1/CasA [Blastocatellia bacterium]